ncbi:MAG: sigma-70 family RNA polymerase sigma factor [Acidimicrobiia bacterium]|nr:sigma-70 family RNA polymerase sigma factor [Acidimicrobiia bacterium]MBT8218160.1 sigma-70 family RNA polymerase sigma factor [Acidimicrobiia bacterium]NNF08960.1 sigma-70 family RNA polymerase sigma factor [Acidimicrobiia bacterium]NNL70898.1 sigma-70 family RNA polymerase sigma factor [Acidimicrobiia bacterium]
MADSREARFTMLYEQHYDEVLAFCNRRIDRIEAEDATADVFAVAWRRSDEIDWDTARPWLYGIARGVMANRWRAGRRRMRLFGRIASVTSLAAEGPDVQVVRRAQDQEVLAAVRRLRPRDQEILLLAAWEELTAPEIAVVVSITVSAAEQRVHRAKQRLAKILEARPFTSDLSLGAADEGRY